MNRKISVGVTVSFALIAVAITFTATMIFAMKLFDKKVASVQERVAMYDKLSEIDSTVRDHYYGQIDDTELFRSMARGYMSGIGDSDSTYLTSDEVAMRQQAMKGTKISVGIEVEKDTNGYMVISKVYADTAASKVGLKAKDVIVKINGKDVLSIGYDKAVSELDGIDGSKLNISYSRNGTESIAEMTRSVIDTASIESYQMNDIFYIRIKGFNDKTTDQFMSAMNTVSGNDQIKGLVFDVRGIDGGYDLSVAANLLDALLPTGTLLTGTYSGGDVKVLFTSDDKCVSLPMVVLVDGDTQGFAEAFAAVLGDSENCRIVGKLTKGKGTLQQLIQLTDGSGIDITVAVLNAPISGVFNDVGVKPDFEVEAAEGFVRGGEPNELNDAQYKKAVDVLRSIQK
ncbi:MAG: S41 family peptidase [Oscillospiraceae bacterium]